MQLVLNDSLEKFRKLVEKDLSALCHSWSLLNRNTGDIVVSTLLLEKYHLKEGYIRADFAVRVMEKISGYPGASLDFRDIYSKALAVWKTRAKKYGHSMDINIINTFIAKLAGTGSSARGADLLGVTLKPIGYTASLAFVSNLLDDMGEQGKQLRACHKHFQSRVGRGYSQGFDHALLSSGYRTRDEVQDFRELCTKVFIRGVRKNIAETGRYAYLRSEYKRLLTGVEPSVVARASLSLNPLQRLVHAKCFGPVEGCISSAPLTQRVQDVLDSVAASIPHTVRNAVYRKRPALGVPELPKEYKQKRVMTSLGLLGVSTASWDSTTKSRSVMLTRYDHLTSPVIVTGGKVDKKSSGLRGRLALMSDSAPNYRMSAEDLERHSWCLAPKTIVLLKMFYLDNMLQKDIGKVAGISQGAVSHHLNKARVTIRLLRDMGRFPTEMEICAFASKYLYEGEVKDLGKADPMRILSAMVEARGKQSLACTLCDASQPLISGRMNKWCAKVSKLKVPPEHALTWKFLHTAASYPYAFQDVDLPHFAWKRSVVKKQLALLTSGKKVAK